MKITENPDGTYTLDPRPGVAEWQEMGEALSAKDSIITELRAELKASREAHHKTTDELRKLKLMQKEAPAEKPVELDLDRILRVAVDMFGGKQRKQ